MSRIHDFRIGAVDHARLVAVANEVSPEENRQFRRLLPTIATEARAVAGHWKFGAPASVVDRYVEDPRVFPKSTDLRNRTRLRQVAVARLALGFFRPKDNLPDSILKLYPEFFGRLAKFLHDRIYDTYSDDFFSKDVRYALGLTIPCGALQFDLNGGIGPKLIARDLAVTRSLHSTLAYIRALGWSRWYGNHLDLRAMKEFTPEGWTASFARIAEVLERNPSVRGVAGVAWFYDPQLARVSPRLSYIGQTPTRHGAFLVKMKTASHDIQNALTRSPIRRKLHETGEYTPACYLIGWPRRELLAWAEQLERGARVAFGAYGTSNTQTAPQPIGLIAATTASP